MGDLFWHFFIGLAVSFLGSLPLGTVNLAVIQTTINANFRAGFYFALGATIIELFYSAMAIKFIAILLNNAHIEIIIQAISIPVFFLLGIYYYRKVGEPRTVSIEKNRKSFFNGLVIGLINPLQIPFWIAYGSYMLSNNWIKNEDYLLNTFIIGICMGTLLVLTLIAFLSRTLISKINLKTQVVNKVIAAVLIVLSMYQTIKVISRLMQA